MAIFCYSIFKLKLLYSQMTLSYSQMKLFFFSQIKLPYSKMKFSFYQILKFYVKKQRLSIFYNYILPKFSSCVNVTKTAPHNMTFIRAIYLKCSNLENKAISRPIYDFFKKVLTCS